MPVWLAAVALVGLAVLVCSTVPAVLRRSRLNRDLNGLDDRVMRQERTVRRLERELQAASEDSFAYERALRALLHPTHRR